MRSKSIWIFLSILGLSQLTGAETWSTAQRKQGGPSNFVPFASSSALRRQATSQPSYDYSGGFPQGFAQGLPTFDFSGPMASAGENKEQVAAESETDSAGFVHGPPDGFPTLDQLGGKFPDFGESVEQPSSSQMRPFQQVSNSPRPSPFGPPGDYDDYESGPPGPGHLNTDTSEDAPVGDFDGPPSSPYHPPPPRPSYAASSSLHRGPPPPRPSYDESPSSPPHEPYPARSSFGESSPPPHHGPPPPSPGSFSAQASGRPPYAKYPSGGGYSPQGHPKKPVYIKTSSKNNKLPSGPPVFYAPSPDRQPQQSSSQQQQQYGREDGPEFDASEARPSFHPRYRRSTSEEYAKEADSSQKDLKPAGTEAGETFWELTSSPFIVFDTYKNEKESDATANASFADHDGGEQRFFPSFPAPAPYLVGPFGGGSPSRPPLFPGPAANRAPSRYLPAFGPKFSPPPPPPNRGPSNVYTAESHDHYQDNNLLGSGNFEVVRGGTYYGDDDDGYHGGGGGGGGSPYHEHEDADYFHHNGHSSPQEGYRLPAQDFFANFRDFADINPPSRSFSHRHEALAAEPRETIAFATRNSEEQQPRQPKNILEKLETNADSGATLSASASNRDSDPMMATF